MCEYAHAMGNSTGNLFKYWDVFYNNPIVQGGFIWDWVDQGLETQTPAGESFLAYGGDFGPASVLSDGNFCMNGIVSANRVPHPGIFEAKKMQQPLYMDQTDIAKGEFILHNRNFFTTLDDLNGRWEITDGIKAIRQGIIDMKNIRPEGQKELKVDYTGFKPQDGVEYFINFSFKLEKKKLWADAGHEVAWEQFAFPVKQTIMKSVKGKKLTVEQSPKEITVKNADFSVKIDKSKGSLVSYKFAGTELIKDGLAPDFWRAPTDNDMRGWKIYQKSRDWKDTAKKWLIQNAKVEQISDNEIKIIFEGKLPQSLPHLSSMYNVSYTVSSAGDVVVKVDYSTEKAYPEIMPRFGMKLTLPAAFNNMTWFGKGPHETYWDRKTGAMVGVYSGMAEDQFTYYPRPQESGNKCDVRWVSLTNKDGIGLLAVGMPLLSVTAKHYKNEELEGPRHFYSVPKHDDVFLNLDYKQIGVGGNDTWSDDAAPYPEFRLTANSYSYTFRIRGFSQKENSAMDLSRQGF